MLRFEIDKKKMMTDGCGSVTSFCKKHGIDYRILTNIIASKRMRFDEGSKAQIVSQRLVSLGVASWEEIPDEAQSA